MSWATSGLAKVWKDDLTTPLSAEGQQDQETRLGQYIDGQIATRIPKTIPAWAPSTTYKAGDVVTQQGSLWSALADHTSGLTFTPANWQQLVTGGSSLIAYAERTTNYTASTLTIEDVQGASVAFTMPNSPVWVQAHVPYEKVPTAGGYVELFVRDEANTIHATDWTLPGTANGGASLTPMRRILPLPSGQAAGTGFLSPGAHTLKVSKFSSTGNSISLGDPTYPILIRVSNDP